MRSFVLAVVVLLTVRCATVGHSPAAITAAKKTQVVHSLSFLRDEATALNTAGVLSTSATTLVVKTHKETLLVLAADDQTWPARVLTSLQLLFSQLSDTEQKTLKPYFDLLNVLLKELT